MVWRVTRGVPNKPSVLIVGDLLFMINDGGILTCLEAKSGEVVWTTRLKGEYSASPVSAEGRVYVFSEDGLGTVFEAAREYKQLAQNTLDEGFLASPAIDGRGALRAFAHARLSAGREGRGIEVSWGRDLNPVPMLRRYDVARFATNSCGGRSPPSRCEVNLISLPATLPL